MYRLKATRVSVALSETGELVFYQLVNIRSVESRENHKSSIFYLAPFYGKGFLVKRITPCIEKIYRSIDVKKVWSCTVQQLTEDSLADIKECLIMMSIFFFR